jgi:hypothetical protein
LVILKEPSTHCAPVSARTVTISGRLFPAHRDKKRRRENRHDKQWQPSVHVVILLLAPLVRVRYGEE